jgi:putative transposase
MRGHREAKRLKVLEEENRRLTKLMADKELIIQTLNEILKKNF